MGDEIEMPGKIVRSIPLPVQYIFGNRIDGKTHVGVRTFRFQNMCSLVAKGQI